MLEIMLGHDGWLRTISLIVCLVASGICLFTAIPSIAAGLWIKEIDRELKARELPVPEREEAINQKKARRGAVKMVVFFVLAVFAANLIHTGIHHR